MAYTAAQYATQAWEWRPVVEGGEMPANGTPVLAVVRVEGFVSVRRIYRAAYVRRHTILDVGDFDGDSDYDAESDQYWWPEGWYEWNHAEDTHWTVDGVVTHWAPLPELPLEECD